MVSTATKLYPEVHNGPRKKRKESLITHPVEGGSKVAQQQAPSKTTTRAAHNAAKGK